uniref:Proline-rich transmembrane protein 3/4 domain-containing protein n=1 Tax=Monopterus albus TaxID=43700 RepID=A0A3Q3IUC1_MONAL|nr:proline-rich transmembrane protein 4-like [Monopterus albus]
MLSLWNLYLLLLLSSQHALALTGTNIKETQQIDTDMKGQHLTQPSPYGSSLAPVDPMFGPENVEFLSLPLSSSEESDRQGVIGEYTDLQESTETSLLYLNEKEFISRPSQSAIEDGIPPQPIQEQTPKYQPAETNPGFVLYSMQTGKNQSIFSASQNETTDSPLPFHLSGSLPLNRLDQDSTSLLSAGSGPSFEHPTQPVAPDIGDGPINTTDHILHRGAVNMVPEKDDSRNNDLYVTKPSGTLLLDGNVDTSATPCKTTNQSWTPTYLDSFPLDESLHPALVVSPACVIPLYSDWNSALAIWGFAWEAYIYGLGSVFIVFGLISMVCLLGLPLRCPPGSLYFTLLHLFLSAFSGIQSFCLLYDAYNHHDHLPPLGSLLLSELSFPCLISAFSLIFNVLSLRLRMHLSLPLAISTSFSALPKPYLLLFISLLHFGVSVGCVGVLHLFHNLPTMILLFPQCVFVCLTIFLSCSYLIFYCLIQVDTKHIYRLNDNEEGGGSPEVLRPASCPFAKVEDWGRAARAGIGAALCLLGCGGLQLYGILHALGLGGVNGNGLQPWPWWGYQVGCRLCEAGVCLGLSVIGTHPLFCHSSSIKTITHPRPGSWSRLSCSSPSRGITVSSQEGANSPVFSSHNSWFQVKQEKLAVCDVITKEQSEALPLCSMVDPPGNRLDCFPKSSQTQTTTILPLPTSPSPPHKPKSADESHLSSLDSLGLESDSSVDLEPPSPINLSRSIDQALFSESLFSHSIFGLPRLLHASSSLCVSSPSQETSKQGLCSVENDIYRTSSCRDVTQENTLSSSRPSQPHSSLTSHNNSPEQWGWKGSISGSTQGLCSHPKVTGKFRSHSWANRGQNLAHSSFPRAIPHMSYNRRYKTLSLASQNNQRPGQLGGTKHLSESRQLDFDLAVQSEFVKVCKQIDALSVCSDTVEL